MFPTKDTYTKDHGGASAIHGFNLSWAKRHSGLCVKLCGLGGKPFRSAMFSTKAAYTKTTEGLRNSRFPFIVGQTSSWSLRKTSVVFVGNLQTVMFFAFYLSDHYL